MTKLEKIKQKAEEKIEFMNFEEIQRTILGLVEALEKAIEQRDSGRLRTFDEMNAEINALLEKIGGWK